MLSYRYAFVPLLLALAIGWVALGCNRDPSGPAPRTDLTPRIISLSPSTTEAVHFLGAGDSLVGRSKFCNYPAEVSALPSVGGYVDPSLEAILSLTPTLVIGARGPAGRSVVDRLNAEGIETFFPPTESLEDIQAMLLSLGEKLGKEPRAKALVAQMNTRVEHLRKQAERRGKDRPKTLLLFGVRPIVVAGERSFAGQMLQLAGATNALEGSESYPTIGMETLLALDPDVILDATLAASHDGNGVDTDAPGWRELRAVRLGRVVPIRDEAVLRPGPRVTDGLATLAAAIASDHPNPKKKAAPPLGAGGPRR